MSRPLFLAAATGVAAALALAIAAPGAAPHAAGTPALRAELLAVPVSPRLGGNTSRVIATDKAFTFLASNAPAERQRQFFFGNRLFNTNWIEFPATVKIFDGLGPTFNRISCSACHIRDGRGRPPDPGQPMESMLVRLSAAGTGPGGTPGPLPAYGDQLNDAAILGVKPEGRVIIDHEDVPGTYGDGTSYTLQKPTYRFADLAFGPLDHALISPRVAQQVVGLGLLEAVPASTLEALADPDDADGDGISGRINRVTDHSGKPAVGRFGWKANVATIREQAAGAAFGDIGITTSLFPEQNCPPAQAACVSAKAEAEPEMTDNFLDRLVTYSRTLAVPVQRGAGTPEVVRGEKLFRDFGCAACHMPTLSNGRERRPAGAPQRGLPSVHRPAPSRHGRRPCRRPPRPLGDRHRVAHATAVGDRAHPARQRPRPAAP